MRFKISLLTLVFLWLNLSDMSAQRATTLFQKAYKPTADSTILSFESILSMPDGGYALLGNYQNTTNNGDMFMMRIDSLGNRVWAYTYGNDSIEDAVSLRRTADGGFIICGDVTNPRNFNDVKMEVAKISSAGDLLWAANFGGSEGNEVKDVAVLGNGDIVAVGVAYLPNSGTQYAYSLTLDGGGGAIDGRFWSKGPFLNRFTGADGTADGGVILAGSSWSFINSQSFYDPLLVRLTRTGDTLWSRRITIPNTQIVNKVNSLPNNEGYLVSGQVAVGTDNYQGTFIMKVANNGAVRWIKSYDASPTGRDYFERIYDIEPVADGYVATGQFNAYEKDSIKVKSVFSGLDTIILQDRYRPFIFKTDTAGNVLWSRVLADSLPVGTLKTTSTFATNIAKGADGGFTIVGQTFNYGNSRGSGFLIHTDKNGLMGSGTACNTRNLPLTIRNFSGADSTGITFIDGGDENVVNYVRRPLALNTPQTICTGQGIFSAIGETRLATDAVQVYPNPANDILFVEMPILNQTKAAAHVEIFDLTGKIVYAQTTSSELLQLETPQYATGFYFLKVTIEGKSLTKKFVISR
jgi:hypothetical protein